MKKIIYVLLIVLIFLLTGCSNKSNNDNQEKLISELDYFSTKIFDLSSEINNISLEEYTLIPKEIEINEESDSSSSSGSENSSNISQGGQESETITSTNMQDNSILNSNEEIDWDKIKSDVEIINDNWINVSIDLKDNNVADNKITEFDKTLNKMIIAIKDENKEDTLKNVSELYSYIPAFMENISGAEYNKIIKETKSELLKAYVDVSNNNWTSVENYITIADNRFNDIWTDKQKIKGKEYKIEKVQLIIQKLSNSVKEQEQQLFFLDYKSLLENINTL